MDLAGIVDIISSISANLDLEEILTEISEKTAQLAGADSCAISLWDREIDAVVVEADFISPKAKVCGEEIDDIGQAYYFADFPATQQVLFEQVPLAVYSGDPAADQAETGLLKIFQWAGVLMLPMVYKGETIGLMELYVDENRNQFTDHIVRICQALANQAAVAIENARLFKELETQREALRQISLQLVNTQEEERRRISRELHDELGQTLTALRVNLEIAQQALPLGASAKLFHSIEEAGRLAAHTQDTARNLSLELRPAMLDDLGLVSTLYWEIDRHEQLTGQTVEFETDLIDQYLQPELEITIYRIITEALTNVCRHADATYVRICLRALNDVLLVSVVDNGVGFDAAGWRESPAKRRSLGLVSMRERAELLNGQLEVSSEIGRGTTVRVQFPVNFVDSIGE